jgi:hypothetical protein
MTLRAQNELLRAALEWYADPETHRARDENGKCVWPILHDGGKRAREARAPGEHGGDGMTAFVVVLVVGLPVAFAVTWFVVPRFMPPGCY